MKKINQARKWHYTAQYLMNPQHPITVNVIGAGGNGSQVLNNLARINQALKRLGHPGLYVTCFDPDMVSEANMGRQLFSPADIGLNKSVVLITRLNQFFGTSWRAYPTLFDKNVNQEDVFANITISCVDSVSARKAIADIFNVNRTNSEPFAIPYYWMDIGNSQHTGQFLIGSVRSSKQPKKTETTIPVPILKTLFDKFPSFSDQEDKDTGPSCSLAEALEKQDLFVNSTLVQLAMGMVWKMFREGRIDYQGAFLNLQTLQIAKIKL